jgi:hypothetical protein
MNKEQQRIAIAEACGWEWKNSKDGGVKFWSNGDIFYAWKDTELPDYLNDLNAMHEAINTLDQIQMMEFYNNHIYDVVCNNRTSYSGMDHANVCNATAAQRAEAFLKTLGLWEEGE